MNGIVNKTGREQTCKKAINFDLSTKELKKFFKSKNPLAYLKAYSLIKRFMKKNGFKHRQWSGYVSDSPMTELQVIDIAKRLNKTFPWLKKCVKKFDVTNIGDTFDLTYIFKQSAPQLNKKQKQTIQEEMLTTSIDKIKENVAIVYATPLKIRLPPKQSAVCPVGER